MDPTPAGMAVGAPGRPLRALTATPALIILLLGGLALRLTIAYVLFPGSGFSSDLGTYASWSLTLAAHGPAGFYAHAGFADYPPAYLYVLWPIGLLAEALGGTDPAGLAEALIKLPSIVVDIAVGYVLYRLVLGWTWPGRRSEALALGAAALYVFNPVTIYDSALWGQTDAVGAFVVLLGVAALVRGNSEGATALAVLAALVKPQFGVVLIPLVAVVLLRRHLFGVGSGPRHTPWGPRALGGWLAREQGPLRLLTSLLVGLAVFHVLALPFGLDIPGYLELMTSTAGGYPYLTVNAYNPWALIGSDGGPSLAQAFAWSDDTVPLLGPVPAVTVGAALLIGGFLWGLVRAGMRADRWTIILAAAFLCIAFFVLPTRVHERYLFPVFVLVPLLAVVDRAWLAGLVALAAGSLINLHGILTLPLYATPNVADLPLGALFREFPFVLLAVVLQTGVFLLAAWGLRPGVRRDPFALAAGETEGVVGQAPSGARLVGGPGAPWQGPVGTDLAEGEGLDGAPGRKAGVLDRVAARVFAPRLRRDRSAELLGEPGGRPDRLDLLLVVLVIIATLSLRGYRLAEPYDMYFDEVYHARTAMEFLQHWRYGERHSIYEYTHPHLAKYAMALGVEAFGENRVVARGDVGEEVAAAALEVRWSPRQAPGERHGDRLYVAGPGAVHAVDLGGGSPDVSIPAAATALAVDDDAHLLYLAGPEGSISELDTTLLDLPRDGPADEVPLPEPFATLASATPITTLAVVEGALVALGSDGSLASIDLATGEVTGETTVDGAVALARVPSTERIVARPDEVGDARAVAEILAEDMGDDVLRLETLLRSDAPVVVLQAYPDDATASSVRGHVEDGSVTGVSVESGPTVAVAGTRGVSLLDAAGLDELDRLDPGGPAYGLAMAWSGLDDPVLYVSTDGSVKGYRFGGDRATTRGTVPMPGPVGTVLWNEPANLVHVLGRTPEGQPTIYVIEPHGDSVFADARLDAEPRAMVMDTQPERPADDRTSILALAADGTVERVEVGSNAFAWRLPGVVMGALTAACLFLLARLLFRRRSVAVFAAALVLAEGMLFANARIAMNDVYVTAFVVAALTLFTAVWQGRARRAWSVAAGLVGVGLLLGLALASKWIAVYAIGGFALLLLLRSALGRLIALVGMIGLTAVLGTLAVRAADVPDPHRNWLFLLMMVVLTVVLAVAIVRRPVRFSLDELRFAVVAPAALGAILIAAGIGLSSGLPAEGLLSADRLLQLGGALIAVAIGVVAVSWLATRLGYGPLSARGPAGPGRPIPDDPPRGWLLPGAWAGIPWLFALACLTLLPVVVYVVSYLPWVALGNQLWDGFPGGDPGQTLWDLTLSMYQYHDDLRTPHAASSPWWAWPLDLKPVWFYQEGFANDTTGVIYDAGNLVVFWMGCAAMAWAAWTAWSRRSRSLAVVVLLFAAMWLPWVRIDRATFQYHVYASLPFGILALAAFLGDLWHGPSRLTWTVARLAAALAILGAPLLWLFRQPLCRLAGTEEVNPNGVVCGSTVDRQLAVSEQAIVSVAVVVVGVVIAAWMWRLLASGGGRPSGRLAVWFGQPAVALLGVAGATLVGVVVARLVFGSEALMDLTVGSEPLALCALVLLLVPAWLAIRARDPRRFALGVVAAAAVFFVAWYPNISGLPLPSDFANVYQGLLPTWNYDFQFAVNLDPPVEGPLLDAGTAIVGLVTTLAAGGAMAAARGWRTGARVRSGEAVGPA